MAQAWAMLRLIPHPLPLSPLHPFTLSRFPLQFFPETGNNNGTEASRSGGGITAFQQGKRQPYGGAVGE